MAHLVKYNSFKQQERGIMKDNFDELNISPEMEIVEQKQKFGIYLDETDEYLLPCICDNIFFV